MSENWSEKTPVRIENLLVRDPGSIRVFWETNLRCNYDCVNCPSSLHSTTEPFPDENKYVTSLKNLKRLLKGKSAIHWAFSGGEPLINPYAESLFAAVSGQDFASESIEICTNLSLPADKLIQIFRKPYERFQSKTCIVASYHYPYTTTEKYASKVKALVEQFPEMEVYSVLLLPLEDDLFWKTVDLFEDLKDICLPDLRLIRKNMGPEHLDYSEKQLEFMNDYFNSNTSERPPSLRVHYADGSHEDLNSPPALIRRGHHRFQGWMCEAGFTEMVINFDFEVMRASCAEGSEDSLGYLFDETTQIFDKATRCDKQACLCTPNLGINKWLQKQL